MRRDAPKRKKKFLATAVVLIITIIAIVFAGIYIYQSEILTLNEEKLTTISTTSLESILEISELSTSEYAYNAIAAAYDEDNTTIKYYVAYDGTVKAGIDFSEININVNEEEKKISINIPQIEIQDVEVEVGTMEYIFTNTKYETETVSQEAYKVSIEDLRRRAEGETALKDLARENAIETVRGLISPWIEQIDQEYEVEIN